MEIDDTEEVNLSDLIAAIADGIYTDTSSIWDNTVKFNVFQSWDKFTVMENRCY